LAEAPQLRLRLLVDDAMIDLIDARIDLAVRVGRLADSSWVARRLCDFAIILCAAPDYLARHGTPVSPEQLPMHQWLALGQDTTPAKSQPATTLLDLRSSDGEQQHVQVEARVASNNQVALQHLCEHGLGIARMIHAEGAASAGKWRTRARASRLALWFAARLGRHAEPGSLGSSKGKSRCRLPETPLREAGSVDAQLMLTGASGIGLMGPRHAASRHSLRRHVAAIAHSTPFIATRSAARAQCEQAPMDRKKPSPQPSDRFASTSPALKKPTNVGFAAWRAP
jgi:hypothetical protein